MLTYLTGEVILWPTPNRIPSDFLECDGQLISRYRYPVLFERIGYSYGGSGDEFAVPNLVAPTPTSSSGRLIHLIAVNGLNGRSATFTNASGMLADVRFLAGPAQAMNGAQLATGGIVPIVSNQELYSLLGTRYGGNGETNFALPTVPSLAPTNGPAVPSYLVTAGFYPTRAGGRSDPLGECFLSEIRLSALYYTPAGFLATAEGGLLPLEQNIALYALIGNAFGGDGRSTFGIPQLRNVADVPYYIAITGLFPVSD